MRVGIFDSGVGGLSVLKYLIENKPNNEYIYFADNKNVPFGNKTYEELYNIGNRIISYFEREKVDIIIIACGTISSTVYKYLKKEHNINIIDIISPTIEYINNKNYNNIGVVGTYNTINSGAFNALNGNIFQKSLDKLALMIETGEDVCDYLKNELKYFEDKDIEVLILGCTHYPLVKEHFGNYNLYDMAIPIIDKISNIGNRGVKILYTKKDSNIEKQLIKYGIDFDEVSYIDL